MSRGPAEDRVQLHGIYVELTDRRRMLPGGIRDGWAGAKAAGFMVMEGRSKCDLNTGQQAEHFSGPHCAELGDFGLTWVQLSPHAKLEVLKFYPALEICKARATSQTFLHPKDLVAHFMDVACLSRHKIFTMILCWSAGTAFIVSSASAMYGSDTLLW